MRAGYRVRSDSYIARFPLKVKAQHAVRNAMKLGKLIACPCEVCGVAKVEAHHPDYAKPLDVLWLCRTHHRAWHREHGQGLNGGSAPLLKDSDCRRDLAGLRVGMLRVLGKVGDATLVHDESWECVCRCGVSVVRRTRQLTIAICGGGLAGCEECRALARQLFKGTRTQAFAALHMLGVSLYSERNIEHMQDDVRGAIASELGINPPRSLDSDVSFSCSDGYDWGSAATIEQLDSPELWTAKIKKSIRERGQETRQTRADTGCYGPVRGGTVGRA